MKKNNYDDISLHVVDLLGGKGNITFVTHCVTRLRFNVKDKSLVKENEIKKLEKVVGAQWSGDQFQIIVGQSVGDAYEQVIKENDLTGEGEVPEDDQEIIKRFSFGHLLDAISGSIVPLIPVLIGAGMIKVLVLLLTTVGLLKTNNPTFATLTFIGDAGFYFLPIFVGATAAKKFHANQGLGMMLGAVLIHPAFVSAITAGKTMSLFNIPIYSASYADMIFPSILAVFIMSYVEKFFNKWSPDALKSLLVPFLTLVVMIPLTLWALAPVGAFIGIYLSKAIIWFYTTTGFLGVGVLAAILPLMVMTGMHTALAPYIIQTLASVGYEPIILGAMLISNLDEGAASLAVGFKTKRDKSLRSSAFTCAVTAIVGGVTEPAMFGINIRLKRPLYCAMFGSLFGGLFAGLMQVKAYAMMGSGGLFGFPVFVGHTIWNLIWMIVAVLIGMIITFIATVIMYKEENVSEVKQLGVKSNE